MALHHDAFDRRGIELERTFDAFARGDLANDERGVETAVAAGNDDAFEGLKTLARAFDDIHVDDDGVAGAEVGDGLAGGNAGDFFLFENLDQIHFLLRCHRHAAHVGLRVMRSEGLATQPMRIEIRSGALV